MRNLLPHKSRSDEIIVTKSLSKRIKSWKDDIIKTLSRTNVTKVLMVIWIFILTLALKDRAIESIIQSIASRGEHLFSQLFLGIVQCKTSFGKVLFCRFVPIYRDQVLFLAYNLKLRSLHQNFLGGMTMIGQPIRMTKSIFQIFLPINC